MLNWIETLIAPWLHWLVIGAAVALFSALSAQTMRLHSAQTALTVEKADRATERGRAASTALKASEDARTEEARRVAAIKEVDDESTRLALRARDDAAGATAADDRLRQRVAAVVAASDRPASNSSAASISTGQPDPGAVNLFADLQRRADETAGILARYADQVHIAGSACEAARDSLTR